MEKLYTLTLIKILDGNSYNDIIGGFYSHDDIHKILVDYKFTSEFMTTFEKMEKFTYEMFVRIITLEDYYVAYIHRIQ